MEGNGHNEKPAWWQAVPPIVSGQTIFTKDQTRLLLGGISNAAYYRLTKADYRSGLPVLEFLRLYPGGPRRHSQAQLDRYVEQLSNTGLKLQRRRAG